MKKLLAYSILFLSCVKEAKSVELYDGKTIKLLEMHVSNKEYNTMSTEEFESFLGSADVGMSNVPVLDQGPYGTCVTFATTAALDAKFNLGDFISQQCSLQLNVTLGNDIWDGAYYPSEVIEPLKKYGVVSQYGCNAKYPSKDVSISVDEYKSRVDSFASMSISGVSYTYYKGNSLNIVKSAINIGKRAIVGFLLNSNTSTGVLGYDLVINGVRKKGGLWACGAFRENCGNFSSGHEAIITGYDDNKKLLKIRNSWSADFGDGGDYYMTYDFFSKQVIDMTIL
jgi:hypothetical protein